jgi:hypothetical protein
MRKSQTWAAGSRVQFKVQSGSISSQNQDKITLQAIAIVVLATL